MVGTRFALGNARADIHTVVIFFVRHVWIQLVDVFLDVTRDLGFFLGVEFLVGVGVFVLEQVRRVVVELSRVTTVLGTTACEFPIDFP